MPNVLIINCDADLTCITVREAGSRSWVEFRGPPYHEWWVPGHNMILHDLLEGWHACVLHAGATLFLLPEHPDYERVAYFVSMMDRGRYPWVAHS